MYLSYLQHINIYIYSLIIPPLFQSLVFSRDWSFILASPGWSAAGRCLRFLCIEGAPHGIPLLGVHLFLSLERWLSLFTIKTSHKIWWCLLVRIIFEFEFHCFHGFFLFDTQQIKQNFLEPEGGHEGSLKARWPGLFQLCHLVPWLKTQQPQQWKKPKEFRDKPLKIVKSHKSAGALIAYCSISSDGHSLCCSLAEVSSISLKYIRLHTHR